MGLKSEPLKEDDEYDCSVEKTIICIFLLLPHRFALKESPEVLDTPQKCRYYITVLSRAEYPVLSCVNRPEVTSASFFENGLNGKFKGYCNPVILITLQNMKQLYFLV